MKFGFIAKHRGVWPVSWLLRGARCLEQWFPRLARSCAERPVAQRRKVCGKDPRQLHLQLSDLWRAPLLA